MLKSNLDALFHRFDHNKKATIMLDLTTENGQSKEAEGLPSNSAYRQLHVTLGKAEILRVVGCFYDHIKEHPSLGCYFSEVKDWGELKARLGHFWWIDLGGERYREDIYNPHAVHRFLKIPPVLIDDWLLLFYSNLHENLPTEAADTWIARATKMAEWIRTDLQEHK